ncbi:MAG TPA: alpha/beta hydrolase [Pyrinomonadaceae bacterium]|nr:alpha/beta hydrolase [Pyrinomonadaceae bacterium]
MPQTPSPGGFTLMTAAAALLLLCPLFAAARDRSKGSEGDRRFAKLNRMRVHYRSFGKGEEALVFVHGWTCDWTFWRAQVPAFSGRVRVIAVDLPGHGESDRPAEKSAYTMDSFARAIEAVMRDAKVKRAVLVGHSMGAPVVRQFYRLFPDKSLALVFVDGALWPFVPRAAAEQILASMRADYARAAAPMVEGITQAMLSAEQRRQVRAKMLATPAHVAVGAMEGMVEEAVWKEDVIGVPALAVLARTPYWPADTEQRFRRLAPDLDFRMWEGVSHFLMMDKPDEFNRELSDFLARRKLLKAGNRKS